jgi:hypothetical protein
MKSEATATQDESTNTLEAPISLSVEQLETVAAGLSLSSIKGTIFGLIRPFNPGSILGSILGGTSTFER